MNPTTKPMIVIGSKGRGNGGDRVNPNPTKNNNDSLNTDFSYEQLRDMSLEELNKLKDDPNTHEITKNSINEIIAKLKNPDTTPRTSTITIGRNKDRGNLKDVPKDGDNGAMNYADIVSSSLKDPDNNNNNNKNETNNGGGDSGGDTMQLFLDKYPVPKNIANINNIDINNGNQAEPPVQFKGKFYKVERVITNGPSKIYICEDCVIKTVANKKNTAAIKALKNERDVYKKIDGAAGIEFYGYDPKTKSIMLEKAVCNINDFMKRPKFKNLSNEDRKKVREFIINRMKTETNKIHKKKVIHNDIKLNNFLLCADGELRVFDLGEARICKDVNEGFDSMEIPTQNEDFVSPKVLGQRDDKTKQRDDLKDYKKSASEKIKKIENSLPEKEAKKLKNKIAKKISKCEKKIDGTNFRINVDNDNWALGVASWQAMSDDVSIYPFTKKADRFSLASTRIMEYKQSGKSFIEWMIDSIKKDLEENCNYVRNESDHISYKDKIKDIEEKIENIEKEGKGDDSELMELRNQREMFIKLNTCSEINDDTDMRDFINKMTHFDLRQSSENIASNVSRFQESDEDEIKEIIKSCF